MGRCRVNTLDVVAAELAAQDNARPRSQQAESGASQVLSCRAELLLRSTGTPPTDPHLNLGTLWGTAIHAMLENGADWDDVTERALAYRGVKATIDRYFPTRSTVVDYKTGATPERVDEIRAAGPTRRQRLQVHLGGAALIEAGWPVERVELLFLPRSGGTVADCWLWGEPFDRAAADEAAEWLLAERARSDALGRPATAADLDGLRDEPYQFCAQFCDWFTLCRGGHDGPSDDDLAGLAEAFFAAKRAEAAAQQAKREAASLLLGFSGSAGPYRVRTVGESTSVTLDTKAVEARAAEWEFVTGSPLPVKEQTRRGYVTVSRAK